MAATAGLVLPVQQDVPALPAVHHPAECVCLLCVQQALLAGRQQVCRCADCRHLETMARRKGTRHNRGPSSSRSISRLYRAEQKRQSKKQRRQALQQAEQNRRIKETLTDQAMPVRVSITSIRTVSSQDVSTSPDQQSKPEDTDV